MPGKAMRQYICELRIPTRATRVPAGADWLHEIKHKATTIKVRIL